MRYKFLLTGLSIFSVLNIHDLPASTVHGSERIYLQFKKTAANFWETAKQKDPATDTASLKQSNWYAEALKGIEESEYQIRYNESSGNYASPNRKNNLRSLYTSNTFTLLPRNDSTDKWKLELTTLGVYSKNKLIYAPVRNSVVSVNQEIIRFSQEDNFIIEYINNKDGIRQNFIIQKEPAGKPQTLSIKLKTNHDWLVNKVHDKEIHFAKATKTGYDKKITYNSLKAWDADNKELDASFDVVKNEISIDVNIAHAVYPITIDPLSTSANWFVESNSVNARYGSNVAPAGDVNGDGYSDVIVGAPYFNGGQVDEGKVFVYLGSITGLSTTAAWSAESNLAGANLGMNAATAGDVNGDGFSDVIVGAPNYNAGLPGQGQAYVYYGSLAGLAPTPAWTTQINQANAKYGSAVASAGDVNGDGFSDVIVGAPYYDGGNTDEGAAFVYYGSAAGLPAAADWTAEGNQDNISFGGTQSGLVGTGVASAGDVNGDGYSDVIIAATGFSGINVLEGKAFVYNGSIGGLLLAPSWTIVGGQDFVFLGNSLACAGDVNGDGYSDVIVGVHQYDNPQINEGRAYVYYGSALGLALTPAWTTEINLANALYGCSVASAGDVNGDGYADVMVGSSTYSNPEGSEGAAFVYYGSSAGLSLTSNWQVETNITGIVFGIMLSSAGDVNGDGYSDVIVGAAGYSNVESQEGAAFAYYGSASGIATVSSATLENNQGSSQMGWSVASAGDVNGDGYSDIIVGAPFYDGGQAGEGAAFVFHGSPTGINPVIAAQLEIDQAGAEFGYSVASAGDVNGDGYSDVIVGAPFYSDPNPAEGGAFIYHGSVGGINTTLAMQLESNQSSATFGRSVSSAGDVNGDGYSDVIVGANFFTNVQANEGVAFVYHGSASGIVNTIVSQLECNFANSSFGRSVACAGDVNGDGYSDVIVGASTFTNVQAGEGAAFIFHGGPSGINTTIQAQLEMNVASAQMGVSVSGAGDVNGDGYSDIIVGANTYSNPQANEGAAFIYLGSATGINPVVATQFESNQASGQMGYSVASAGDVNGDGYSDIIIGAYTYTNGEANEGVAYVYQGSAAGIVTATSTLLEKNQVSANFGVSVACAGDVNGDGYSDVIVGAHFYNNGTPAEGAAFVYLGNNGGGLRNNLRLYNTDLTTPISHFNVTEPNLFGAGLFSKSPLGRLRGRLVWEVKSQSDKFSGIPITNSTSYLDKQPFYTNLIGGGTELKFNVQKVGIRRNKVRTRVEYNKATAITGQVYGPWRYPAGYTMGAYGMNSVPLPLTLISFNGNFMNADDVKLNWITTNEINMQSFMVERSTDGLSFMPVKEIAATGQGSNRTEYSLIDKNVTGNLLYYRIKLTERSGTETYTKTITVSRGKLLKGFIAPDPVQRGNDVILTLRSASDQVAIHINIYNSYGQLMVTENKILQKDRNDIPISTNKLAKGIYVVQVAGDNIKESYRLVVQ